MGFLDSNPEVLGRLFAVIKQHPKFQPSNSLEEVVFSHLSRTISLSPLITLAEAFDALPLFAKKAILQIARQDHADPINQPFTPFLPDLVRRESVDGKRETPALGAGVLNLPGGV
ncbi:MAG: hypothetical protein WCW30_03015 [Candidatus Gracilibacteria bacterium]